MLLSTQVIENLVGGGADQLGLEFVTATMDIDESASLDLGLDLFSRQEHQELDEKLRQTLSEPLSTLPQRYCRSTRQPFSLWQHADVIPLR